ncbi:hypothetical protein JZX86_05710 [Agrobacterium rosae]|uniref:hypothetical protein n=1 Tax=Agrobacterium rosae TaxID=1972867 RepID=UPI0019D32A54|nr:hypothetical protein [Agrobacterium rosae]MBN7804859.1 hypothetical protein [Agrobacterium rosae]
MSELAKIAQRLIKWDADFPVNGSNGYVGLQELNKIIADAKTALKDAGFPVPADL